MPDVNSTRVEIELSRYIRAGDTIHWGQTQSEPASLIRRLIAQRHGLGRIRLLMGMGRCGLLRPEHADAFDCLSYCGSGANRALAAAGVLDIIADPYSRLPHLIATGALRVDVIFAQVSPPDNTGRHSLGLVREYLAPACATARVIIGEVCADVPWTFGGPYFRADEFTHLIHSEAGLVDDPVRPLSPIDIAIGRNIANFVSDGATLQTGIGSIPDAALAQLVDRRDLGIHSGAIGDGVAALWEAGGVTNARKSIDAGRAIGGVLMGSKRIRALAHRNPSIELRGTDYTHAPEVLGRIDNFVAINSALEVDLTGQANCEVVGGAYIGGIGGILDFLTAAGASRGGAPVIALPSTSGGVSRITPRLAGPVTVPRSTSCVIVTEYGVADVRGVSLKQRPSRLIAIAHPDHRETLERAMHNRNLGD